MKENIGSDQQWRKWQMEASVICMGEEIDDSSKLGFLFLERFLFTKEENIARIAKLPYLMTEL